MITQANCELGISLELNRDLNGSANTKADNLTYYSKSEVDHKFTIIYDSIINT